MDENLSEEAKRIYQEVAKKLQLAKDSGIVELVKEVYEETKYYPSYKTEHPDWLPSEIKDAKETGDKSHEIQFEDSLISFIFTIKDSSHNDDGTEFTDTGNFEVWFCGKKVLGLRARFTTGDWGYSNTVFYTPESFIEGAWMNEVRALHIAIEDHAKERGKKAMEDPDKLKKLKEDFGI